VRVDETVSLNVETIIGPTANPATDAALPDQHLPAGQRVAGAIVLLSVVAFAVFIALIYFPNGPLSPNVSPNTEAGLRELIPEGWAFFTKSQRDEQFSIFRRIGTTWVNAFDGPQGEPHNMFGLNRAPRAEGIEFGLLKASVGPRFVTCNEAWQTCAKHLVPIKVTNTETAPLLCGPLIFILQKPVPWSWAQFSRVAMPTRILSANVACR
jgi:antimicrobial peptide system SdpA family protein